MRTRVALNGTWWLRNDAEDRGVGERWFGMDAAAIGKDSRAIEVPVSWDYYLHDDHSGPAWYAREFDAGELAGRGSVGLAIAGVARGVRVWLNGRELERTGEAGDRWAARVEGVLQAVGNVIHVRLPASGEPGNMLRGVWLDAGDDWAALLRTECGALRARASAAWVSDAVVYEVYPRAFSPGGDFVSVGGHLGRLAELGVNVLWFMPIHPIGVKNRKGTLGCPYAVQDYYAVNGEFGTLDDFRRLVDRAHERGMRVIIDWVANHTAWDGPVIEQHPEWYERGSDGAIRCPVPDWTDTAQLDYGTREVREYMGDAMRWWLREVEVDGFRCDVAGMVPLDFWEALRPTLDAIRPNVMLAEDELPIHHRAAFDLSYDWRLHNTLGGLPVGSLRAEHLEQLIGDEGRDFPGGSLRMRFSLNHDLCAWHARDIERLGPEAAKAAAAITYALPGVPLIYTGQEVGNTKRLDLFERVQVDWDDDREGMTQVYRELNRVRRERVSLRRGVAAFVAASDGGEVLGVRRESGDEGTLALVNLTDEAQRVDVASLGGGRPVLGALDEGGILPGFEYAFYAIE